MYEEFLSKVSILGQLPFGTWLLVPLSFALAGWILIFGGTVKAVVLRQKVSCCVVSEGMEVQRALFVFLIPSCALLMCLEHTVKVEQARTGTFSSCCWVKIMWIEQKAVQRDEFVIKSSYILPGNRWEAFSCKNTVFVCTEQTNLTNQTGLIFFLLCILQPLSHILKTSV